MFFYYSIRGEQVSSRNRARSGMKKILDICPISDYNQKSPKSDKKEGTPVEQQHPRKRLDAFNSRYRELDAVYHALARFFGLSDCAFWILYTIRETGSCDTQSQLCDMLSLRKQTINSALKSLETAGYIRLEAVAGNQKSKQIVLTETGKRFAAQSIDRVLEMEEHAFAQFSDQEQAVFFRVLGMYVHQLERSAQAICERQDAQHNDSP